ncbi:MAG: hypothetical protein HYX90_03195 [Chloroflexi bacterium]|nr:hypothetical protein [Chloroflexota bacterium]
MSTEIPQAKKLQAVRLYFEGLPYDEIASKTGMAKGSVAAIVEDLREGRIPQFEHLSELLNELRDIAVQLRKAGMSITEASLLFAMTKRLIALGVEPSLLERWVRMCQSVGQDDLHHGQIIQAATKLAKLEGEGLSYEETLANLTNASAQLRELEEKLAKLRTEEGPMEERRQELLRANRDLEARNVELQRSLDGVAVNVKEGQAHCQELGKRLSQRHEAVNRLERRERELTKKNKELEEKAQTLRKQVDDTTKVLKDIEELGFSRSDLEKLRARLKEMAEKHGKVELAVRFYGYLANYDSLLGLEAASETLAKEVNSLTEQRDSLALLGEKLMLTPDDVAERNSCAEGPAEEGNFTPGYCFVPESADWPWDRPSLL